VRRLVGDAPLLPVKADEPKLDGRRARAERTHQAIVSALLDLADEGKLAPTALEIADRAGVAVRSIRQHFASREALFLAASAEHGRRIAHTHTPSLPSGKLADRVSRFVASRTRELEATSALRRAASLAEPQSDAIGKAVAQVSRARRRELEGVFAPELAAAPRAERKTLLDALDVATSGRTWDALKREMKLSAGDARLVVSRTVTALLG
jgi:TetR/AcrR family transcriptional regulator, regulator of autoinduction and epiphytic fitness